MRSSSAFFEDFAVVGFRGSSRLQRMIDEQRHRVKRMKASSRFGPGDEWDDDDYDDDDDYSDYTEDEFDSHSITR